MIRPRDDAPAPPGWYPDPAQPDAVRWWDGGGWTGHTAQYRIEPWGPWTWLGFVLGVLAATACAGVAAAFVLFADSTVCGEAATARQRLRGVVDLVGVGLAFAFFWGIVAVMLRHRWRRFAVAGVITIMPIVLVGIGQLGPNGWQVGFCF